MNHKEIKENEIIEKYILRQLSYKEDTEFEEHLMSCEECSNELEIMQSLINATKQLSEKEVKKLIGVKVEEGVTALAEKETPQEEFSILEKFKYYIYKHKVYATAALIILLVGIYAIWEYSSPKLQNPEIGQTKPEKPTQSTSVTNTHDNESEKIIIKEAEKKVIQSSAFITSKILEKLCNTKEHTYNNGRSGTTSKLKIIHPEVKVDSLHIEIYNQDNKKVIFEWKTIYDLKYKLSIYNNKAKRIDTVRIGKKLGNLEEIKKNTIIKFIYQNDSLRPGLYYFNLKPTVNKFIGRIDSCWGRFKIVKE